MQRRRRPTIHLLLGIGVLMLALLVPTVASAPGAAKKKKRTVDLTVQAARVATTGDRNTVAGTFRGPPYGSGAVIYRTRPAGSNIAAKYKGYLTKGTIRGTSLVTPTPGPNGTTSFTGTLQVTGGTGRYRGARGKDLVVTGTLNTQENIFRFNIKGTVRY